MQVTAVREKARLSFFCFYWLISQCVCSSMNISWYVSAKWYCSYCVKQSVKKYVLLIRFLPGGRADDNITGRVMMSEDCWEMGWRLPQLFHDYEAKDKMPLKSHSHAVFVLSCISYAELISLTVKLCNSFLCLGLSLQLSWVNDW